MCSPKESHGAKRCEVKGDSQEMAVMVEKFQKLNNDNSGEFVLPSPQLTSQIHLKFIIK